MTILVQSMLTGLERLTGASLLVLKNKSDVAGSMNEDEIREVSERIFVPCSITRPLMQSGPPPRSYPDTQVAHHDLQCYHWPQPTTRIAMGRLRR